MRSYVRLDNIKTHRKSQTDGSDSLFVDFGIASKRIIDTISTTRFDPMVSTRYFDHPNGNVLKLKGQWLLEAIEVKTSNGGVTIPSTDYLLKCGGRYDLSPYDRIELKANATQSNWLWSGTFQQANAVTGIWGYHEDWANAWVKTGATLENNLTSSELAVGIHGISGFTEDGITPKFSVFDLIRVDSEYMEVYTVETTKNYITVIRGANGTTKATHLAGAEIWTYRIDPMVLQYARRMVAYLMAQKDAQMFDVTAISQMGQITVPSGYPKDLVDGLASYRMMDE